MALTPDALRVAESVTVTADAFSEAVPSAAVQTTLNGREVKALSSVLVGDPIRAMANLPGVALTNDYEARFAVRGAPFARVGFYLDDVYLPSPMHGFGGALDGYSISALNNQVIERMTLIPVAPPSTYADAAGAALVVETREGSRIRPSFRTSVGMSDANMLAEGPLTTKGRGSWLFAARKSYLGNVIRQLGGNAAEVLSYDDLEARVAYDITPRDTISVHVLGGNTRHLLKETS